MISSWTKCKQKESEIFFHQWFMHDSIPKVKPYSVVEKDKNYSLYTNGWIAGDDGCPVCLKCKKSFREHGYLKGWFCPGDYVIKVVEVHGDVWYYTLSPAEFNIKYKGIK